MYLDRSLQNKKFVLMFRSNPLAASIFRVTYVQVSAKVIDKGKCGHHSRSFQRVAIRSYKKEEAKLQVF
jgi:hypothetical protein